MDSEGFFRAMPPIRGAVDAVKEMSGMDGYVAVVCALPKH